MLELINQTRASIAEYEQAGVRLANVLLGHGYIVVCQDVYLTFDIEPDGGVTNPRHCQPHLAVRFTKDQAELLAAEVRNGNGTVGQAIHVKDAIALALDAQRAVMETINAFLATSGETVASLQVKTHEAGTAINLM